MPENSGNPLSLGWVAAILVAAALALPLNLLLTPSPHDETARQLNLFHQVQKRINKEYYLEKNPEDLFYKALEGMVGQLDRNSQFFRPPAAKDFHERNTGEFAGLGIRITIDNGRLIVIAPMPGSPAIKAGLRAGDVITHVDGEKLPATINVLDASKLLKGLRFTKVRLQVERWRTGEVEHIEITRDRIHNPGVENVFMLDHKPGSPGIAYLKLRQFQQNSEIEFLTGLNELKKKEGGFNALILDLRNNPGGDLEVATAITDYFISVEDAVILTQAEREDNLSELSTSSAPLAGIPICFLLNRHSASASELVAGALRDYGCALMVGERTHGKGSVQTLYHFRGYEEVLKLTTALYHTPNKHSPDKGSKCRHPEKICHHKASQADIKRGGLRPDLEIPLGSFEAPIHNLLAFASTLTQPGFEKAFDRISQRRTADFCDVPLAAAAQLLRDKERYKKLMDAHN
ncbi:MAG: PDZ domain-containing protein [Planctomycetota bacterium]|nr:MAG: PDZ domain-containing protein [Planctomycetota bacterium]